MTINRRHFLISALGAGMALPNRAIARSAKFWQSSKRRNILFVHGAFHGGWCWERLMPFLPEAEYRLFTPTLRGLGSRAGEFSENIGLKDHVDEIVELIDRQDLDDAILLCHSYGGLVATGAADRRREKISHLIYLDAYVPIDGGSFINPRLDRTTEQMAMDRGLAVNAVNGAIDPFPPEVFGVFPEHPDYKWVMDNLTPHPAKTWLDPISLPNGGADNFTKTYIHCVKPKLGGGLFEPYARLTQTNSDWTYFELATGHDAMITAPDRIAEIVRTI